MWDKGIEGKWRQGKEWDGNGKEEERGRGRGRKTVIAVKGGNRIKRRGEWRGRSSVTSSG